MDANIISNATLAYSSVVGVSIALATFYQQFFSKGYLETVLVVLVYILVTTLFVRRLLRKWVHLLKI